MKLAASLALLALATAAVAQAPKTALDYAPKYDSDADESKQFQEQQEVPPPAFPGDATLVQIDLGPAATNKYFIDAATLAVGEDGVVRYVLVVKTAGGATNISFEGMHCATLSWKHYASGRSDKAWTVSRAARREWRPIENKPTNPHHAVLSRSFFCPQGNAIRSAEDGRNALRLGKHPNSI